MAIITISRGTFSGGQTVAEQLAERLGYDCLSREGLIEAATEAYGVPIDELTAAMDRPPTLWERLVGERGIYLNYLRAALLERAQRGNLVFHGYVAHLLLPPVSHVISVRVIENLDYRVENAMRRHNIQRKEAIAHIKKIDRERGQWTRFLWGVDWQDPSLYDAVLNLAHMSVEGAVDVVAFMKELEIFQPTPASVKEMEDSALGSRVWVALATDEFIGGVHLKATADDGIVTVTGTVDSVESADTVSAIARRVPGVRGVRCEVSVSPPLYDLPA